MKLETLPVVTSSTALRDILGCAVVLHWEALACQSKPATVRIEYHVGPDGALESLKLWACAQEYWSLVCDYSPHMAWADGPRFSNGFHSRQLGRLLQSIVMNQNLFRHECTPNSNATLEIGAPTPEDTSSASLRVTEAFQRLGKAV
jgi:hypothetical protein